MSAGEVAFLLTVFSASALAVQYDLYTEASTWEEARDTCSRNNKQLVHVTELLEHRRIQYYRPFIYDHFWIGLKQVNLAYKWTDSSLVSFTAWGQGQPSSQSTCVRYNVANFTWETHDCSDLLYFMCERDVPTSKVSGNDTMVTGLLVGFAAMFGLLLLSILLLQMPCFSINTAKAMQHIVGLG